MYMHTVGPSYVAIGDSSSQLDLDSVQNEHQIKNDTCN